MKIVTEWNEMRSAYDYCVIDTNRDVLQRCTNKSSAYAYITLTERQNAAFA